MNNFIVGQVTPDMLTAMPYGTYIFFGLLTFLGSLFIWFLVPETKGLTLEEMDIIFGSVGTAQADAERMREVNKEVGLDHLVHGNTSPARDFEDEKAAAEHKSRSLDGSM